MSTQKILELIRSQVKDARVRVGFILGSGLGHLADAVSGIEFSYSQLDGFPQTGVSGHISRLVLGELEGVQVAIFGGRAHYYEHGDANAMRIPLEVLSGLGAEQLFLTNAAGSLRNDISSGEIMMVRDHINFSGQNPLIGEVGDDRFVNMVDAYDPDIRTVLAQIANKQGIRLQEGVYAWFSGPSFETPAEINAMRILGADVVGMSTVPEVILGRFLGLRCTAISTITNMAAGMSDENISHAHTKQMAPLGAQKLERLIRAYLRELSPRK